MLPPEGWWSREGRFHIETSAPTSPGQWMATLNGFPLDQYEELANARNVMWRVYPAMLYAGENKLQLRLVGGPEVKVEFIECFVE